ncbi:anthranilate synthase component II [Microbacterium sp. P04]|uniref:anthranilate synthase component II n=1 Tax=Microbacterium sp. P04 TaxID=3366947 RepID=UPI003745EFC7
MRVLVVDNHDSFVHTLVDYLIELGAEVEMVEADAVVPARDLGEADAVVISPGPGTPEAAGSSVEIVREAARRSIPLLGVCLGHQAIGVAFGGTVGHAPELMHGMTSDVHHDDSALFRGLPDPFVATRYHSLTVAPDDLPRELTVTARTESGVIMAFQHRSAPITGVQFHPESILTEGGYQLLGNWLEAAGLDGAAERAAERRPRGPEVRPPYRS